MAQIEFTAGCMIRQKIRRELLRNGFEFTEDKGFLNSFFIVKGSQEDIDAINKAIYEFQTNGNIIQGQKED